ncbi:ATP-binding protein [Modestobacter sp. I12A-02628]|uniref:ATP-binding protein n=2 Tax=Goekera deserti TaxID=2497753 RepID=A0A7K3WFI8_9ACTN|nr:ATP-binding protein [Goekera deserti]NDI49883.1 ATP-binding protein [Goekera deserti]NEL55245.1 ATP-binding protein [Goekera deserti]
MPDVQGPVWRWDVTSVRELAALRAGVRDCLDVDRRGPAAHSPSGERLLLAVEELTSNALRHGELPVRTAVTAGDEGWLLSVTDAAGDRPPAEAVDRDPALGGLGLKLTATLAGTYGWVTDGDRKHVWAYLPFTPGDLPPDAADD